jgi:allantoicase
MEKLDIRIFDVLGKVVYDEKAIKSKKIDMSELKNGVYILTFIEKGITIQTKRVIVRH